MEGGENRLNVAITRAKEKIYLVTSIEPEDLNVTYAKNVGPKVLKKYLQYARAVSLDNKYEQKIILESLRKKTIIEENFTEGIEKEIQEALQKKKYIVDRNLGNTKYKINLAVYSKKLDRYVLGIEIDSSAFESSESLLERDVYRTKFLNSRGWNMMRLWSRDWWTDKDKTLQLIEGKIAKAVEKVTNEIKESKKKKPEKMVEEQKVVKEENPLADGVFEYKTKEKAVISTRLNRKLIARLEEDGKNAEEIAENIRKINENPEYTLQLEDFSMEENKGKKKREKVVVGGNQEENASAPSEVTPATKKKTTPLVDGKYLDEVDARYQGKKDRAYEKKNKRLNALAEKMAIKNRKKKEREDKIVAEKEERKRIKEEKELKKQEVLQAKREKEKAKRLAKKYNKKEMTKVKSQLGNLAIMKEQLQKNNKYEKVLVEDKKRSANLRKQKADSERVGTTNMDEGKSTMSSALEKLEFLKSRTANNSAKGKKKDKKEKVNKVKKEKKITDKKIESKTKENKVAESIVQSNNIEQKSEIKNIDKTKNLQSILSKLQNKDKK